MFHAIQTGMAVHSDERPADLLELFCAAKLAALPPRHIEQFPAVCGYPQQLFKPTHHDHSLALVLFTVEIPFHTVLLSLALFATALLQQHAP